MTSVELHTVLVEYAEDAAATTETAGCPDVIDGVTAVVMMVFSRSCFVSAVFVLGCTLSVRCKLRFGVS